MDIGWVRNEYWSGKCFTPPSHGPPYLTFLGTMTFAHVASSVTASPLKPVDGQGEQAGDVVVVRQ